MPFCPADGSNPRQTSWTLQAWVWQALLQLYIAALQLPCTQLQPIPAPAYHTFNHQVDALHWRHQVAPHRNSVVSAPHSGDEAAGAGGSLPSRALHRAASQMLHALAFRLPNRIVMIENCTEPKLKAAPHSMCCMCIITSQPPSSLVGESRCVVVHCVHLHSW